MNKRMRFLFLAFVWGATGTAKIEIPCALEIFLSKPFPRIQVNIITEEVLPLSKKKRVAIEAARQEKLLMGIELPNDTSSYQFFRHYFQEDVENWNSFHLVEPAPYFHFLALTAAYYRLTELSSERKMLKQEMKTSMRGNLAETTLAFKALFSEVNSLNPFFVQKFFEHEKLNIDSYVAFRNLFNRKFFAKFIKCYYQEYLLPCLKSVHQAPLDWLDKFLLNPHENIQKISHLFRFHYRGEAITVQILEMLDNKLAKEGAFIPTYLFLSPESAPYVHYFLTEALNPYIESKKVDLKLLGSK